MNKKIITSICIIFLCIVGFSINNTLNEKVSEDSMYTYADSSKVFSFSYPSEFILSSSSTQRSKDWSVEHIDFGTLLTTVQIQKSFLPGTNFSDAKFTVGTSSDPRAVRTCLISPRSNEGDVMKIKVGDREFTRITFGDVGAGNYYETQSYRAVYNNECYAVEYTIHSTNIYNYSPDQGIKEFDKQKIVSVLESMVQSFRFK